MPQQMKNCNQVLKVIFFCLKGLKMQYQVAIIGIVIMVLAMLLVGLAYYIYSKIIITLIQTSSKFMLAKQDHHALSISSIQLQQYINQKQNFYILRLGHVQQFFQFYINHSESYTFNNNQYQPCLLPKDIATHPIQLAAPLFCYFAHGVSDFVTLPHEPSLDIFNKTIQQLNQFTTTLDATNKTLIGMTDLTDTRLFAAYPNIYIQPKFNPRERIWQYLHLIRFKNHIEQMKTNPQKQFFFSPTYFSFADSVYSTSLTITVRGFNDTAIGVMEQLIQIGDSSISNVPYNIMLVNQQGQVILVGIEGVDELNNTLHIYDSNITGFNTSDWSYIQDFSLNTGNFPTCDDFPTSLCLFNTYFNKSVIISATLFSDYNFTLVMQEFFVSRYSNISFSLKLEEEFNKLTSHYQKKIFDNLYAQIFCSAMVVVISSLAIYCIFKPLRDLMQAISYAITSAGSNLNNQIFKMLNGTKKPKIKQNSISALKQCIFKFEDQLQHRQNKKNQVCIFVESLDYPKKSKEETQLNVQQVIKRLPNQLTNFAFDKVHSNIRLAIFSQWRR